MTTETENTTMIDTELSALTVRLIRRCAESDLMTSDGNFNLKYAFEASTTVDELTTLLGANSALDQTYEMLNFAGDELSWLIENLRNFSEDESGLVDVGYLNSELLPDLLASCRTIYERLERDTAWIKDMEAEIEKLVED